VFHLTWLLLLYTNTRLSVYCFYCIHGFVTLKPKVRSGNRREVALWRERPGYPLNCVGFRQGIERGYRSENGLSVRMNMCRRGSALSAKKSLKIVPEMFQIGNWKSCWFISGNLMNWCRSFTSWFRDGGGGGGGIAGYIFSCQFLFSTNPDLGPVNHNHGRFRRRRNWKRTLIDWSHNLMLRSQTFDVM
jgi:hypothetical protein